MMKIQTNEFITGYVFAEADRKLAKKITEKRDIERIIVDVDVPKIWFHMICALNPSVSAPIHDVDYVTEHVTNTFKDVFPNWNIECTSDVNHQYQRFKFYAQKKIERKKITIQDIEKILGYRIEIISEV